MAADSEQMPKLQSARAQAAQTTSLVLTSAVIDRLRDVLESRVGEL